MKSWFKAAGPGRASLCLFFVLGFAAAVSRPAGVDAAEPEFPRAETPRRIFFVGEKLVYGIRYLGIPLGTAQAEVRGLTEVRGREAYHIVVRVRSHSAIDLVYKVRDAHHSFIDAEHFHSLEYRKFLNEGASHSSETVVYDQDARTARRRLGPRSPWKGMEIPRGAQDPLSCGYFFRTVNVKPESSLVIPVNEEGKNWELEVLSRQAGPFKIRGIGKFEALETEPRVPFQGVFVKRGKIRGWISLDERRIPLQMKIKVPFLGSITAKLKEYRPGVDPGV